MGRNCSLGAQACIFRTNIGNLMITVEDYNVNLDERRSKHTVSPTIFTHGLAHARLTSIPCPGRVQIRGATYNIAMLCQAVCRLHELIREHVWKVRMLSILALVSEVVISHVDSTDVDILTWRQEFCIQLIKVLVIEKIMSSPTPANEYFKGTT